MLSYWESEDPHLQNEIQLNNIYQHITNIFFIILEAQVMSLNNFIQGWFWVNQLLSYVPWMLLWLLCFHLLLIWGRVSGEWVTSQVTYFDCCSWYKRAGYLPRSLSVCCAPSQQRFNMLIHSFRSGLMWFNKMLFIIFDSRLSRVVTSWWSVCAVCSHSRPYACAHLWSVGVYECVCVCGIGLCFTHYANIPHLHKLLGSEEMNTEAATQRELQKAESNKNYNGSRPK